MEEMEGGNNNSTIIKEITDMIERMSALKRKIESAGRDIAPHLPHEMSSIEETVSDSHRGCAHQCEHMHEQIVSHFHSNLKNLDQYHFTEEDDRYHLGHVDGRRQELREALCFMQMMKKYLGNV